ncbi:MAG: hypothetical protein HDQ99_09415 [Lachnospiraceae bacterium]|nr:hypothetical protein [Lachnospiraceae bacterium]
MLEQRDMKNNLTDDEKYFKLLEEKGYKVFIPDKDSPEALIIETLQNILEVFVGPDDLDINIRVKIFMINNDMINAAVCKRGDSYYITIFRGVINGLRDFILNFVMPNFPYEYFHTQFEKMYEGQSGIINFFGEMDHEHFQLANNIANNILFLIVYHEMGHILSGQQEICLNDVDDFWMESNQNKRGSMLFQAKELIADYYGMINSLGICNYRFHTSFEEYSFYQCIYLISLYSLYIYFERGDDNKICPLGTYEELFQRSHPHPAIRLLYMMDLLSGENEYELKQLFKVEWLAKYNEKELFPLIDAMAYGAICEFSLNLSPEFRLVNKVYEKRTLRLRQLIQNIASDLCEETYNKVTFVGSLQIGRVADKYVDDLLQQNDLIGKYDASDE